jgi:hypothetical protein
MPDSVVKESKGSRHLRQPIRLDFGLVSTDTKLQTFST